MIFLILAILSSTAILVTFRFIKRFNINIIVAITVNYLVASGFGFALAGNSVYAEPIFSKPWITTSLILGFTFIAGFHMFAMSAQKIGIAITAVAGKMSVVIPVVLGFIMFNDYVSVGKIVGIVFALTSFYLIFYKPGSGKFNYRYAILPLMVFIFNGANDSGLKISETYFITSYDSMIVFLSVLFFVALLFSSVLVGIDLGRNKSVIDLKSIITGIFLGVLNWYSTLFFLQALTLLDVSLVVPVMNASIVALAAIVGFWFFKESLKLINWIGIATAIVAILLIALS